MIDFLLRIDLYVCFALMGNLVEGQSKHSKKEVSSLPFWINFPNKLPYNNSMTVLMISIMILSLLL
jgi:hypothetical protein